MKSPSYHGYDVSDYYSTNPDYGSMADFQELVTKAHAHGIKVIIDFVMNHTSDQHPWFTQSANNQNGYRDWYIWSATNPGYLGPWGQTVWNYKNNSYYYALFYSGMPDLNYRNPAVKTEMFNVTNFWLGKGIDGFRLDAIKYLIEDSIVQQNTPETLDLLTQFNTVYKSANPDAFSVGEVWDPTTVIIPYVQENRLDACFEFTLAGSIVGAVNSGNPSSIKDQLNIIQSSYPILQYGTFLTNHDMDRVFTQLETNQNKMKQAAFVYLTLPGIPFIYYGEEVGMIGSGADENKRRPMQWTDGAYAGFSTHVPWIGVGNNYLTNNVSTMTQDQGSLLTHYKKLIRIRNEHAALRRGYLLNVNCTDINVLSYARIYEDNAVVILSNFGSQLSTPSITLPVSSLPAGTYYVTELYGGISMGTLTIDSNGGFSSWHPTDDSLAGRDTWILLISSRNPGSVSEISTTEIGMTLVPNPATLQVQVNLYQPLHENYLAEVFTSSGSCIYQVQFTGDQITISTLGLPAGVYFVKISCGGKSRLCPLIVMK
jgi:alpha-amylase